MTAPADMDLRGIARAAEAPVEPVQIRRDLVPRELQIRVLYTAPDGLAHEAVVVSRILTMDERAQVARARSIMTGGRTWESFALDDQAWITAAALVSVQLRDLPAWLAKWGVTDIRLLMALYEACEGHASRYFRGDVGAGKADTGGPRILVSPVGAPTDPTERK